MFEFEKVGNQIIFIYHYGENVPPNWMRDRLKQDDELTYKSTFNFKTHHLYGDDKVRFEQDDYDLLVELYGPDETYSFVFAELAGEYYKILEGVITKKISVFFHKSISLVPDYFYAENNLSIFAQIEQLVNEDIYIGGNHSVSIPKDEFDNLVNNFPNSYEKGLYAKSRISSILRNYFDSTSDEEFKFKRYLRKKPSKKGKNLIKKFQEYETTKFQFLLSKLESMLNDVNAYNEDTWQNEILQIILLLYPKYILSFKSVFVKADIGKRKFLDFMLVDSNGHIDIIEIKQPFEDSIMTKGVYRDNFIPKRELSGTVMQLEKYIFYLNRWGEKGEKLITQKLKDKLPLNLEIKIINPKGFIIMGRDNNLSAQQKSDFEVIKRKYNNVIDIITYDDLLQRLKSTIYQFQNSEAIVE
ncbi:Shedu immune nuclease family protein [Autumnicola psychrophila]|uniref:Shedu immune nuclease family protein n=1 Tax=Autumnicola psychrophila TaxID=3075592 RepID=A0ABU3DVD3_9FLAO|nr:Shedu immune nuclease family protein [Zunongwangia sp. F225]MDT0687677.1 Shedu immune nuclease family protein [Zunongwangia sp. F225]